MVKKRVRWANQLEQIQTIRSSCCEFLPQSITPITNSAITRNSQIRKNQNFREGDEVETKGKEQCGISDLKRQVRKLRIEVSVERYIVEKQGIEMLKLNDLLEKDRLIAHFSTIAIAVTDLDLQLKLLNTELVSMRLDMLEWRIRSIVDSHKGENQSSKDMQLQQEEQDPVRCMNKCCASCLPCNAEDSLPPPLSYIALADIVDEGSLQQPCFLLYETPTHKLYLRY